MGKTVFIAEKPSVAKQFAQALKLNTKSHDGYLESENTIITWCVGHLVTMSYPESYDEKYKKWSFSTLPFLPTEYKYEVIKSAAKQYKTVSGLLNREDVETIYVCTDSGREGEYIYRLVEKQANVEGKIRKRVWIDSQTDEEIIRGIKEAKDLSEYDSISDAAYLRAKEDYLMGINFSRALSLKYGNSIAKFLGMQYAVVSVGRVMTCVLGMVVKREREIREFVKTPFYRVLANLSISAEQSTFPAEFRAVEGSKYFESPLLYSEKGFKERQTASDMIAELSSNSPNDSVVTVNEKKKELKNPPLLYNLADLQNVCSKLFKITPAETLQIIQELYERKLVTYPRTDARVLSTAVAKEIYKNITGLKRYQICADIANEALNNGRYKNIAKTKYVNDKQITDHYAVIPTGQGFEALPGLSSNHQKVYEIIVRRFLSIFFEPAEYQKISLVAKIDTESFFASFKVMTKEGYLPITVFSFAKKKDDTKANDGKNQSSEEGQDNDADNPDKDKEDDEIKVDSEFLEKITKLKVGDHLYVSSFDINEGETSPPKRYTSGNLVTAMEKAGQTIEDDEFREQLKGSGIGTSATRAGIIEKLINNKYLKLNKKTQVITPELLGEMIYDVVDNSIKPMLDPTLTASWEKGLSQVAEGTTSAEEYMEKLNGYVARRTEYVRGLTNQPQLQHLYNKSAQFYKIKK